MPSISFRFTVALTAVALLCFAGAAYLNFAKFQQTYVSLAQERYDDVVTDLADTLESGLGAGLSLSATQTSQVVIDRVRTQYAARFEITVVSPAGAVLFATPRAFAGRVVAPADLAAGTRGERLWRGITAEAFVTSKAVTNPLGQVEGFVLVEYARGPVLDLLERLRLVMWVGVAVICLPFVAVLVLIVTMAIRPVEASIRRDMNLLDGLVRGQRPPEAMTAGLDPAIRNAMVIESEVTSIEREAARVGAKP